MSSIAAFTSGGGVPPARSGIGGPPAPRSGTSWRSGSCTPTMPRSLQAIPHRPIAVSKSANPAAVVMRSGYRRRLGRCGRSGRDPRTLTG